MSTKRARKHHFLPQALQRYFLDEKGKIWFAERSKEERFGDVEVRNTKSTFKESDYYTVFEGGVLSDRIEKDFYAVIDDFLAGFLREVHATFDEGSVPIVKGDALASIRRVAYHSIVRTPEFTSKYDDYEIGRDLLEGTISEAKERGLDKAEIERLEVALQDTRHTRNFGRTIRVKSQAKPNELILRTLDELEVRFVQSNSRSSFILSSLGAYRIGNGGHNGLSNPNMEIWMPISPKRALVLLRDTEQRIPMVLEDDRDHIRHVNEFAVRNSRQVASHSKRLLQSLLG